MASKGRRRSLILALVGSGSLALAWFTFPQWLPILAAPFLDRFDVQLETLEIARPDTDGVVIHEGVLSTPFGQVRIEDAHLRFDSNGDPLLDVATATLTIDTATATDGAGAEPEPDVSTSAQPLPSTLLPGLPFAGLAIGDLSIEDDADTARLRGRLVADADGARFAGTLTQQTLSTSMEIEISVSVRDEISLTVEYGDARAVVDATLASADDALSLQGELAVIGRTPEAIDLEGLVPFSLALNPDAPALALRSRATLVVTMDEGQLDLASPGGFEVALAESKLTSTGALDATLAIARDVDALSIANTKVDVRLKDIGGPITSPTAGVQLAIDSPALGELKGTADLALDAVSVTLPPGASMAGTLRVPDGPTLDGLDVRTLDAVRVAFSNPLATAARISARVDHAASDELRLPLSELEVEALWRPASDGVATLALEIGAPGLEADAVAALDETGANVRRASGQIDLASAFSRPVLEALLEDSVTVTAGRLTFRDLTWPPSAEAGRIELSTLSGETPDVGWRDLTLDLRISADTNAVRLSTAGATLGHVETETGTLDEIIFDATMALPLPGAHFDAWDGTADLDAFELRAQRGAIVDLPIEALIVTGTGDWNGTAIQLDAQIGVDGIEAGVPITGTACTVRIAEQIADLESCGAELLGGRIDVPSARVDLSGDPTGDLPVALEGLDLGAVLILMQDEALDGSGTLDGALPLRLNDGVPTVVDGYVGARPPGGRLRYATDAGLAAGLNQPGLDLAIAALGDFRYERLGSYIDYEADGTLGLRMRLEGSSPDVENGRPINFNLSVTQNLPLLLQSLRLSQNIGEALERRLQERPPVP